jgi:hypothetical protein
MDTAERWLMLAAVSLIALCALLFVPAFAHDHERPELNEWFKGLHSPGKGVCCDGGEALHLRDVEWETQDKPHSHYRVKVPVDQDAYERARAGAEVDTVWVDVEDDAVIDEPNKAGSPLVWPVYSLGWHSTIWVRCFMPGTMG